MTYKRAASRYVYKNYNDLFICRIFIRIITCIVIRDRNNDYADGNQLGLILLVIFSTMMYWRWVSA